MLYCILVMSCWCNSLRMQRMHFIVEFCIYLCDIAAVSWLLWGFNGLSLACWPLNKCVPVTHIGRSLLWASYGSPELALSQNHPDQTRANTCYFNPKCHAAAFIDETEVAQTSTEPYLTLSFFTLISLWQVVSYFFICERLYLKGFCSHGKPGIIISMEFPGNVIEIGKILKSCIFLWPVAQHFIS